MLKRMIPFLAAGAMFFGANALHAQSSCSKGESAKCAQKCADKKAKGAEKADEVQFSQVTLEQLNSMMTAGTVTVIDARDQASFDKGHIDGAFHLASYTLPADKNASLVFYCGGPMCAAAPRAARKAISEGYTNVMVFTGGWLEWNEGDSQAGL